MVVTWQNLREPETDDWREWRRYFVDYTGLQIGRWRRDNGMAVHPELWNAPARDDITAESNYHTGLDMLQAASDATGTGIHKSWVYARNDNVYFPLTEAAVTVAMEICQTLNDYPILDESDHSEREWDHLQWYWGEYGREILTDEDESLDDRLDAVGFELETAILGIAGEIWSATGGSVVEGGGVEGADSEEAAWRVGEMLDWLDWLDPYYWQIVRVAQDGKSLELEPVAVAA